MKRITKQETLPALAVPEVLSVPELAYPARLGKRAVVQVLRKADVKKAALAVGGTALVLSAIGNHDARGPLSSTASMEQRWANAKKWYLDGLNTYLGTSYTDVY